MPTGVEEPEEPDGYEPITPEHFLPASPFPADAQRLGFDRYTGGEAAWIALAASLDPRKPSHRIFAVLMLVAVLGSLVLTLWGQLR